jgi:tRNA (cytidine/uridine-2'-O-)-methyltransferase
MKPRLDPDPLCRVVLVEPLIPENTGNVSRTCVATRSELHLVEPMAFEITESRVKRAGLDYWPDLAWQKHADFAAWRASLPSTARVFCVETGARRTLFDVEFRRGDWLVFGKETTGLSVEQMRADDALPNVEMISIPMPGTTRSLNLSNAVAVTVFELLRQTLRS